MGGFRGKSLLDLVRVFLTLLFHDVEGDLVSNEVLVFLLRGDELLEQFGGVLWQVKMEHALRDFVVVPVIAAGSLSGLLDLKNRLENVSSELL